MQSSFSAAPSSENALNDYLQIQGYLAQDTFQGVHESAKLFQNDSKALGNPKITEAVKALVEAKDLTSARVAFMPLSELIKDWAKKNHPKGLIIAYCPMKEAHWLQKKGPIQNPYYGKEMLECGVVE